MNHKGSFKNYVRGGREGGWGSLKSEQKKKQGKRGPSMCVRSLF